METVETFEKLLKEVVQAKRLSASKMTKLTEIALKCMEMDTQLVSSLYRTHKTLPPASKSSSLYAFDALARAARNQVNKRNITGDLTTKPGNCATFLLKMEGVLDGFFQDMMTVDLPEAKEKTKKVLDIWTKSNTFPPAVLARLSKLAKGKTDKETNKMTATSSTDPRQQVTPPAASSAQTTPPLAQADVQSTLLALLSQAANAVAAGNGQTTSNTATSPSTSALDANQLALFQQLAQPVNVGGTGPTAPVTIPVSLVPSSATANAVPPVVPPQGGPSQPPYRNDHYGPGRRNAHYDRYDDPDRGRNRDEQQNFDDRREFRGGYRGGFRGRGRGRWDDRTHTQERHRDRDFQSPPRSRRSRSRSPPRGGSRHTGPHPRSYSPPHRPPYYPFAHVQAGERPPVSQPDKDEFGRDLRQTSSSEGTPTPSLTDAPQSPPAVPPPASVSSVDESSETKPPNPVESTSNPASLSPVLPINVAPSTIAQGVAVGLESFDLTTFNPTDPASWEALGKAWAVSNGYMPSQDELMQFMMSASSMGTYATGNQYGMQQQGVQWGGHDQMWDQTDTRRGRGRGRGRGGGYGRGNGRDANWGYSQGGYDRETDAITLGGGEEYESYQGEQHQNGSEFGQNVGPSDSEAPPAAPENSPPTRSAGKMQRVGDKWVFVRAGTTETAS